MDNGASSYRRFLSGDESAFDEIMNEYFHSLVFFINRYVYDVHTAEDIAIDVFSDLIVHKRRYNFKVSLKTYLFMLARSRALDFLRHKKVLTIVDISDVKGMKDDEKELEEIIFSNERKRTVANAIEKLPNEMQIAVHLVYFEELTYEQAATVMKKSRKQVDNLLYRAKKELKIILGKDGQQLLL